MALGADANHSCTRRLGVVLEISPRRADRSPYIPLPGLTVTPDRSKAPDDDRRVIPFRPPGTGPSRSGWRWRPRPSQSPPSPVEDLAKYEGGAEDDNYRHRMLVNLAALLFTVALAAAGVWLAIQIAEMRRNQDCVLSGRRNCTPVDINALER
jgi:hypothetical protein